MGKRTFALGVGLILARQFPGGQFAATGSLPSSGPLDEQILVGVILIGLR
jgi:hypothetical protein